MRKTVRALATILGAATIIPTAPAAGAVHVVAPGETLSGIAAGHGLSTASLAAANGLGPDALVISGTRLKMPAAGSGTAAGAPEPLGAYKVRAGDTLSGLAAQSRVPVAQMAYMNG